MWFTTSRQNDTHRSHLSLKSKQTKLLNSLNFVHCVVLSGDLHSSGTPSIIKQTLRIKFAYLTVYSVSSYRSIHPDEMKGWSLLLRLACKTVTVRFVVVFSFFKYFYNVSNCSAFFNRYSMCLILFLFMCYPLSCQTLYTLSPPWMSSQPACLCYVCVCVPSDWSPCFMFCVCARLLYVLV